MLPPSVEDTVEETKENEIAYLFQEQKDREIKGNFERTNAEYQELFEPTEYEKCEIKQEKDDSVTAYASSQKDTLQGKNLSYNQEAKVLTNHASNICAKEETKFNDLNDGESVDNHKNEIKQAVQPSSPLNETAEKLTLVNAKKKVKRKRKNDMDSPVAENKSKKMKINKNDAPLRKNLRY